MKRRLMLLLTLFASASFPLSAVAYVGPGLGAGAVGAVLGVIAAIFLGLFAILWYPFKRMLKKRSAATEQAESSDQAD